MVHNSGRIRTDTLLLRAEAQETFPSENSIVTTLVKSFRNGVRSTIPLPVSFLLCDFELAWVHKHGTCKFNNDSVYDLPVCDVLDMSGVANDYFITE